MDIFHHVIHIFYIMTFCCIVRPCPLEIETSDRGVFEWPQTQVGGVARLPCPCPMNPALTEGIFAVRKCLSSTLWGEPDWTACTLSEKAKQLCNVVSVDSTCVYMCSARKCKSYLPVHTYVCMYVHVRIYVLNCVYV